MEKPRSLLDEEEVVMNAPSRDERALVGGDHLAEARREAKRENFGEQLSDEMDQADWPVIKERGGISTLGKEGDQCLVKLLEGPTIEGAELCESLANISLDRGPARTKELRGESIGLRCLAGRELLNSLPNFVLREWLIKVGEVKGALVEGLQV